MDMAIDTEQESCLSNPPTCEHHQCHRRHRRKWTAKRLFLLSSYQWWSQVVNKRTKKAKHDSQLPGYRWMLELWGGHEDRFFEQFRMRKEVMGTLIMTLTNRYGFVPFDRIAVDESLAMFLMIIGHGMTFTNITERFQHSGQTVSAHFHEILAALCRMAADIIKPEDPYFQQIPTKLVSDKRYFPSFRGCIGAIDGTHITLRMGEHNVKPWFNRKGVTSTNVLTVVDFNLCITYAKVGLEGSMHDSRILYRALRDERVRFPIPPEGKYYVADAGYPNMKGFLTPYRKTRYHLPDFRQAGVIRNRNENFNYKHASLRSMVERTFGILKERFKILRHMTKFNPSVQIRIIWATFAVHNFLRRHDENDLSLLGQIEEEFDDNEANPLPAWREQSQEVQREIDTLRDEIRDNLPMRGI